MSIPEAEFAPSVLVGYVTEQGGFYRTEAELPLMETAEGEWVTTPSAPVWRQLSCSDPDDMRAIWRRAALALGATEEEALHADFHQRDFSLADCADPWKEWLLDVREWCAIRTLLHLSLKGCDTAHATAALCRAVWGPK